MSEQSIFNKQKKNNFGIMILKVVWYHVKFADFIQIFETFRTIGPFNDFFSKEIPIDVFHFYET